MAAWADRLGAAPRAKPNLWVVSQRPMHSIPTGSWPSEAFWLVYIVRQSFPRRSGDQAIQRLFLQVSLYKRFPGSTAVLEKAS
jgi:hypothetical protein